MGAYPLVSIVDDDESVRESLPDLLRQFGFAATAYASAEEFLGGTSERTSDCLILDVVMPGMSGPLLQAELTRRGLSIPIVFVTGQADATLRQQLLSAGAAACLYKPFSEAALLAALNKALTTT